MSIESGFGFLPYLLKAMDWQWFNDGLAAEFPDSPLPSELFRRQVYGTFWFEKIVPEHITPWIDNVMFETDYPHPTSLSPGPTSTSLRPAEMAAQSMAGLDDASIQKVVHGNAARVYNLHERR